MENEKFSVLEHATKERDISFVFPDEAIFSNVYHTSLSRSLRGMLNVPSYERRNWESANQWLLNETKKITTIRVINFDNLKNLLHIPHDGEDNDVPTSCDAFFYNFDYQDDEFHFIVEFKNTNKKNFIDKYISSGFVISDKSDYKNDEDQPPGGFVKKTVPPSPKGKKKDSLYLKVKDSIEFIRQKLIFGGNQEDEEIIRNMHLIAVYNGKNTRHTSARPKFPGKNRATKGANGKQCHATKNDTLEPVIRGEHDIYNRLGNQIAELGLKPRTRNTFLPIKIDPRINPYFTILSAQDFGQLIDSGFFDNWKWGKYLPDTESITESATEGIAENT